MSPRKRRAPAVVVLGDINVDVLAPIEAFPKPGEDCLAPALELHLGGVAANTAVALARWGLAARLMGCVGRDAFGDLALDSLRRARVDVSGVQRTDRAATGLMFIAITADGERTIFGARGANTELKPSRRARYLVRAQAVHLLGYNFLSA
jgi:ribokinase